MEKRLGPSPTSRRRNSETTEYDGRAVASLAADSKMLKKTGKLFFVGDLQQEYGFKDADGTDVGNFPKEMGMM